MTELLSVALRLKTDDFVFSSIVIRHLATKVKGALVVLGCCALFLAGCQAETAPAPKSERPVQVQRVVFENGGAAREFVGVVHARHETDLGFRVSGKVVERAVNVGDRVRKGDVIARLDPKDLRLQVESAESELAAATSNRSQAAADL